MHIITSITDVIPAKSVTVCTQCGNSYTKTAAIRRDDNSQIHLCNKCIQDILPLLFRDWIAKVTTGSELIVTREYKAQLPDSPVNIGDRLIVKESGVPDILATVRNDGITIYVRRDKIRYEQLLLVIVQPFQDTANRE